MPDNNGIPGSRVQFTDQIGTISNVWFRFLYSLWQLTGAGGNTISLSDLQQAPQAPGLTEQIAELAKTIQALQQGAQAAGLADKVSELAKTVEGLLASPVDVPARTLIGAVQAVLDFPSTAAQTSSDLTVSVPGAVQGDVVRLSVPNTGTAANSCYTAWVSAADTVTIRFNNYSAAAINPASASFRVVVDRI